MLSRSAAWVEPVAALPLVLALGGGVLACAAPPPGPAADPVGPTAAPAPAPPAVVTPLDLAPLFNADLFGPVLAVDRLPSVAGLDLAWPDPAAPADAVALGGPTKRSLLKVSLPVQGRVERLHLVWTVIDEAVQAREVARLVWTYQDGLTREVACGLNEQIHAADRWRSAPDLQPLFLDATRALSLATLPNPRPEAPVAGVELRASAGRPPVYLVAAASSVGPSPVVAAPVRAPLAEAFPFTVTVGTQAPQPAATLVTGPVGAHGFVRVREGRLVFEDGAPARFWGVNLVGPAALPPVEQAAAVADALAGMGVNLVRLHHFDGAQGVLDPARVAGGSPFAADRLDRFDRLVAELEARGIYLLLEVATQHPFLPADGVAGPTEGVPLGFKALTLFDPSWQDAYVAWTRQWLLRTNPHTGRRYTEDPGVALVELSNENSLLTYWASGNLESLPAPHLAELDRQWNAYLARRYPDEAALRAAWSLSELEPLRQGERWGQVRREPSAKGLAKAYPDARVRDLAAFYQGLELRFYERLRDLVRQELGVTVPLIGTINYGLPLQIQTQLGMDVSDAHLQLETHGEEIDNLSLLANPERVTKKLGFALDGQAAVISELNVAYPNASMAEAPLLWAALGALHQVDAIVWFQYTHGGFTTTPEGIGGPYEVQATTSKWVQMPTASALFRSGALLPAPGLVLDQVSLGVLADDPLMDAAGAFPSDVASVLGHRLRRTLAARGGQGLAGAPGPQVGWWADPGLLVVDLPWFQAVVGRHDRRDQAGRGEGGGPTAASGLVPELEGFAAVSLVDLDGGTLEDGGRALLTAVDRSENADLVIDPGGRRVLSRGEGPVVVTRLRGRILFRWPSAPVVRPLDPGGQPGAAVPVAAAEGRPGWWALAMDTAGDTVWWSVGS